MRTAKISRKTKETDINVELNIDGEGKQSIETNVPFMNHMLELFARHGHFDLIIQAKGDNDIDDHHTIEDLGIVMGQVFKEALGDKKGINRYGFFLLPMDESLALVSLDISNRPFLSYEVNYGGQLQNFDKALIKEFLTAFVINAGITLHIKVLAGDNTHHIIEAVFKGLAKSLRQAVNNNPLEKNIPSTKGIL